MPFTEAYSAPGLSFEFDHVHHHYSPGDVISGRVILDTTVDSAIGRVTVAFGGRAKSLIVVRHGEYSTYHRGRTRFFYQQKILYQGQYTHKPSCFIWPFEFVVPDQADSICIQSSDKWNPSEMFLSTQTQPLDLTLPASMYHKRYTFGREAECFIEYVLEATVTEPEGVHVFRRPQSKSATLPVIFRPRPTPEPIQNYKFTSERQTITISTLKLLPEHSGTSLGVRDLARSIFKSSSIPRFSFELAVQAPTIIQLFHPQPIPFLVTAIPNVTPEKTSIDCSEGFPEVILRTAKIKLKVFVRCRAARGTSPDTKSYEIPLVSQGLLNKALPMAPSTTSTTVAGAEATLNLGTLCSLRLGNAELGSRLERPLCPSFVSYNVSRFYQLTWTLEVECAEKRVKFHSSRHAPTCAIILPPANMGPGFQNADSSSGANLGLALTEKVSAQSAELASGSGSGFGSISPSGRWSSRLRLSGRSKADREMNHDEEEEEKQPRQNKVLTKEEEAAQDRLPDGDRDNDSDTGSNTGNLVDTTMTTTTTATELGTGTAPPPRRYVP